MQPNFDFTEVKSALQCGRYDWARQQIQQCASCQMENPQLFNLLGICYELQGNHKKACTLYRVAYYLDQTFAPALFNLERLNDLQPHGSSIDWGI